jgi:hypothetical protein
MEDKGAPPGMIETQLHTWAAGLDRLKAKVEKQLAEAKAEYYEHIRDSTCSVPSAAGI